ncbi:MAG TPA: O-antigen ligase family protein, partial [Candidatus Udaeobacter sp.]|nr:O-antigen ligase family protein [Candidatus Udaeobacter sp.]
GVWAVGRVMRHETVMRKSRLGGIILILLGLAALSIVRGAAFPTGYTYRAGEATYNLIRSGMTFAIYFIGLAMVRGERMRRRMAWAIVLGLLAEAVVTGIYGRNGRGGRAIGSFDQSNELGAFLAMFSAFAAAMIPGTRRWFGRLLLAGAVAAGGFAVLLSVSRAAMIALVVSLFYVALRSSRLLLLVFLAALLTSPLWAPDFVKERISGSTVETEDEQHLDAAAQVRLDTWHAIMTVVTNHPLDGVGFTGLGDVLPEAGEALAIEVKDSAHNTYLRMLAEMGILGLVVFVVLLWRCLQMANEGVRHARTRFDRQIAVGFGAATLAMAVSCMFGDRFFSILITGNFWMLGALVNDALLETRGPVA